MRVLRDFFWFGVSGALGFLVDSAVLYGLKDWIGLFVGRVFSFLAAVFVTWIFNRTITFSARRSGMKKRNEFATYLLLMMAGGVVNIGIYSWMVKAFEMVAAYPVIGVASGSLAGMVVNLATSRSLLYRN